MIPALGFHLKGLKSFAFVVALFLIHTEGQSKSLATFEWNKRTLHNLPKASDVPVVNISSSIEELCRLDFAEISLTFPDITVAADKAPDALELVFAPVGSLYAYAADIETTAIFAASSSREGSEEEEEEEDSKLSDLLRCADASTPQCVVFVNTVTLLSDENIITVVLNEKSNEPLLPNVHRLSQMFNFVPPINGEASASWIKPDTLQISVEPAYFQTIMSAYHAGETVAIGTVPRIEHFRNHSVAIRFSETGQYVIFVRSKSSGHVLSQLQSVKVGICNVQSMPPLIYLSQTTSLPSSSSSSSSSSASSATTTTTEEQGGNILDVGNEKPHLRLGGVVSVPANLAAEEQIRLMNDVIENKVVGERKGAESSRFTENYNNPLGLGSSADGWSVSMWIKLLEGPTGSFRSILFKGGSLSNGPGSDTHRTPSLYLLPHTNLLAVRVSSNSGRGTTASTIGADSTIELPINKWTLISLIMENSTIECSGSVPEALSFDLTDTTSSSSSEGDTSRSDKIALPPAEVKEEVAERRGDRIKNLNASNEGYSSKQEAAQNLTAVTLPQCRRIILGVAAGEIEHSFSRYAVSDESLTELHGKSSKITAETESVIRTAELSGYYCPGGLCYKIGLYVNNQLDISMSFSNSILGNQDPLMFFNDFGSHTAPKAFLKGLTVWNKPLTGREIVMMYNAGEEPVATTAASNNVKLASDSAAVDTAADVLMLAGSPFVPFAAAPFLRGSIPTSSNMSCSDTNDCNSILGQEKASASPSPPDASQLLINNASRGADAFRASMGRNARRQKQLNEALGIAKTSSDEIDVLLRVSDPYLETVEMAVKEDSLAASLLHEAKQGLEDCSIPADVRTDLYAEAASRGSAEALFLWAMLMRFGVESPRSQCGMTTVSSSAGGDQKLQEGEWDQERAVLAFLVAADMGHAPALVPLADTLVSGIGADLLLEYRVVIPFGKGPLARVPVPASYLEPCHSKAAVPNMCYKQPRLLHAMGMYVQRALLTTSCNSRQQQTGIESVLCSFTAATRNNNKASNKFLQSIDDGETIEALALGLLHFASLHGVADALYILAHRYATGEGLLASAPEIGTSAEFARRAALDSHSAYHKAGQQPIVESQVLDDRTVRELPSGESGLDDEKIQHQKVRAAEGHLPSVLAMGDLYYYGARGLPRDQNLALDYYMQGARAGSESAAAGAAGMILKGEGNSDIAAFSGHSTEKFEKMKEREKWATNASLAIELFEMAAKGEDVHSKVRALNGLGFLYYNGRSGVVDQNLTKAFEYFDQAAATYSDGDSLNNAAVCLENGIGTKPDMTKAVKYYSAAARSFGHFDSIVRLGNLHMVGQAVPRSPSSAIEYFAAANSVGPWSGWLRMGLNRFFEGSYTRAVSCYAYASEFMRSGPARLNAAYILHSRMPHLLSSSTDTAGRSFTDMPQPGVSRQASSSSSCASSAGTGKEGGWVMHSQYRYSGSDHHHHPQQQQCDQTTSDNNTTTISVANANTFQPLQKLGTSGLQRRLLGKMLRSASNTGHPMSGSSALKLAHCYLQGSSNGDDRGNVHADGNTGGDIGDSNTTSTNKSVTHHSSSSFPTSYSTSQCGVAPDMEQAIWWYTKAAQLGEPLGSLNLAIIHHFGIGGQEINLVRANRYYAAAVKASSSTNEGKLGTQMDYFVKFLQFVLKNHTYLSSLGVHSILQYAIRYMWE